jgi:hypothetical protein
MLFNSFEYIYLIVAFNSWPPNPSLISNDYINCYNIIKNESLIILIMIID